MSGVALDLTLTLGNILESAIVLGGGVFALSKISNRMQTKIALLHLDFTSVKEDMTDMKSEIKKVNEVLVMQTDQNRRITRIEQDIRELRVILFPGATRDVSRE